MTGDKIKKEEMAFSHLSDIEMADKVRMLSRGQIDHEAVCVGARDRIMYLSQQLEEAKEFGEVLTEHLGGSERYGREMQAQAATAKLEAQTMRKFLQWCVDNWICDSVEETYAEQFCGSPTCRRCEAKRILDDTGVAD